MAGDIKSFESRGLPGLRFDWMPATQRLYLVRVGVIRAECIATDVSSPQLAETFVEGWVAGYKAKAKEVARGEHDGRQHYRIDARGPQSPS